MAGRAVNVHIARWVRMRNRQEKDAGIAGARYGGFTDRIKAKCNAFSIRIAALIHYKRAVDPFPVDFDFLEYQYRRAAHTMLVPNTIEQSRTFIFILIGFWDTNNQTPLIKSCNVISWNWRANWRSHRALSWFWTWTDRRS